MKKIISLILLCFITLIGCFTLEPTKEVSASRIEDFVQQISIIKYKWNIRRTKQITAQQYLSLVNNKEQNQDFIVYFGYKDCQYCRAESKYINRYMRKNNYPVYYINMEESLVDATQDDLQKIDESLEPYTFSGTPTFAFFRNNKIQNMLIGYPVTVHQLKQIDKPINTSNEQSSLSRGSIQSYLKKAKPVISY
ncbi:thioredoxin fold domain-containing protein [Lactobacillus sp. ESL0681]|uniref:thioredoxin fold domain-containing protein n=1 Tax=Lactobacillus sp. ESL0681 TaxID=2983211 RepID=UPI0023F6F44F|nr:thioredoxin fold domain-containing protein [Lactobacillus sp. ESL0681]WEV40246.1 pediocin PapC-like protein [Lactobacillus sp. ESL0681]